MYVKDLSNERGGKNEGQQQNEDTARRLKMKNGSAEGTRIRQKGALK